MKKYMGFCPWAAADAASYIEDELIPTDLDYAEADALITVHQGFCLYNDGTYYCHCWTEYKNKVYDFTLQKTRKKPFDREDYYRKNKPITIVKMTPREYTLAGRDAGGRWEFFDERLAEMNGFTYKDPKREYEKK